MFHPRPCPHARSLRAAAPRCRRPCPRPDRGVTADEAFAILDPWLGELRTTVGPFPMPRGLGVVLTQSGGGMEYYGATTTSLRALRHEVFHMYYGCSTVARTYRDSWWDEGHRHVVRALGRPHLRPVAEGLRSDIVSGRSAVAVGFDRRAYDEGRGSCRRSPWSWEAATAWCASCATCTGGARSTRSRRGTWRRDPGLERERRARAVPALALPGAGRPGDEGKPSPWDWLHRVGRRAAGRGGPAGSAEAS